MFQKVLSNLLTNILLKENYFLKKGTVNSANIHVIYGVGLFALLLPIVIMYKS